MGQRVLWVIREKHTDHVYPTLKQAQASNAGIDPFRVDPWSFDGESIRIISRIVVDTFRKKGSHVRCT